MKFSWFDLVAHVALVVCLVGVVLQQVPQHRCQCLLVCTGPMGGVAQAATHVVGAVAYRAWLDTLPLPEHERGCQ